MDLWDPWALWGQALLDHGKGWEPQAVWLKLCYLYFNFWMIFGEEGLIHDMFAKERMLIEIYCFCGRCAFCRGWMVRVAK